MEMVILVYRPFSYSNFHKEVHCTGKQKSVQVIVSVIVEVTVFKNFNAFFISFWGENTRKRAITFLRRLLIECYILQTFTYYRISSKQL
jgi:hypothetical protein